MAKYYIQSGADFEHIISAPTAVQAVSMAFKRSYDAGNFPPPLNNNIYLGERGFVIRPDGSIRQEGDAFQIPTITILAQLRLLKFYAPPPPMKPDDGPEDYNPDGGFDDYLQ